MILQLQQVQEKTNSLWICVVGASSWSRQARFWFICCAMLYLSFFILLHWPFGWRWLHTRASQEKYCINISDYRRLGLMSSDFAGYYRTDLRFRFKPTNQLFVLSCVASTKSSDRDYTDNGDEWSWLWVWGWLCQCQRKGWRDDSIFKTRHGTKSIGICWITWALTCVEDKNQRILIQN